MPCHTEAAVKQLAKSSCTYRSILHIKLQLRKPLPLCQKRSKGAPFSSYRSGYKSGYDRQRKNLGTVMVSRFFMASSTLLDSTTYNFLKSQGFSCFLQVRTDWSQKLELNPNRYSAFGFLIKAHTNILFFIPASKILASNGFYWFKWLIPLTYASVMLSRIERYFSLRRSISSIFFRKSRFFVYAIKKLSLLKNG